MSYAIDAVKKFGRPPIVLTFVVARMKYEVLNKSSRDRKLPYLLKYPCSPWAKDCLFVESSTIKPYLKMPLNLFLALSAFFLGQHASLLASPYPSIRSLYKPTAFPYISLASQWLSPTKYIFY
ncbi:hypothetical protein DM01DRAFT_321462 [Hesseltinella vesiculosa]|uniref:Uncharacterized protein n=1 Tax=Hesseltinella vesiculosa TaxID=101127 RepID=A0A1X2GCE7_9FUNG|nr:hypothetical protein DM01DRAFT_321462 [Hesseltinella vesiculosa]